MPTIRRTDDGSTWESESFGGATAEDVMAVATELRRVASEAGDAVDKVFIRTTLSDGLWCYARVIQNK